MGVLHWHSQYRRVFADVCVDDDGCSGFYLAASEGAIQLLQTGICEEYFSHAADDNHRRHSFSILLPYLCVLLLRICLHIFVFEEGKESASLLYTDGNQCCCGRGIAFPKDDCAIAFGR